MNLTAISTLETAVAKGTAYLDSRYPGWRWRVDIGTFEATCQIHSITGQLFGESLLDQLHGVGINPGGGEDDTYAACAEFAAMGFTVMVAEPVEIPGDVRLAMKQAVDSLAAVIGPDYPSPDVPTMIPIPRDADVVRMEAEGLQLAWERELNKR
jgi:hypothetical protein